MFALQPELKVFSGSANRDLAERICKYIGVPLGQANDQLVPGWRNLREDRGKYSRPRRLHHSNRLVRRPISTCGVAHHGGRGTASKRGSHYGGHPVFGYARQDPQR